MSQVIIKSPKHCAKQTLSVEKLYKRLFYILTSFFISLLCLIFLTWLILHPSNPEFSLKQADIYQLNLTTTPPHLLTSSMQITFLSKNPNKRLGLDYDNLQTFASYNLEKITNRSPIPSFYQAREETNMFECSLVGKGLPVAPSFGYELSHDQASGTLSLHVKMNGRLRWKMADSWVSHWYRFHVDCVTTITFDAMDGGQTPPSSKQGSQCSTNV